MVPADTLVLLASACTLAVVHTVLGVDHYLPVAAVGRANGWSLKRTLRFTLACGIGHVGSALVLGGAFAILGLSGRRLLGIDIARGNFVAWLLVVLGAGYAVLACARRPHKAVWQRDGRTRLSAWAILLVFVIGPCEPLIPLMLAGGAAPLWWTAPMIAITFGAITIGVMLVLTALCYRGLNVMRTAVTPRFAQVLAGAAVSASGVLILVFGL